MRFSEFNDSAILTESGVFVLKEGIDHIEALPHDKFIDAVKNLSNFIVSEKLDGCLHGGTTINTLEFGDLTIQKIVDDKVNCKVKAVDHSIEEIVYVPVLAVSATNNPDAQWYVVELENGRSITLTGNHKVYLPELKCYRRVDELTGDETILID